MFTHQYSTNVTIVPRMQIPHLIFRGEITAIFRPKSNQSWKHDDTIFTIWQFTKGRIYLRSNFAIHISYKI